MKHTFRILIFLVSAGAVFADHRPACLEFNGVDQYVHISNENLNFYRSMTLEFWFRVDEFRNGAALIDNAKPGDDNTFWGYGIYTKAPDSLLIRIGNGMADSSVCIGPVPRDTWQHFSLTFDRFKNDENMVVFLNGKVIAKGDFATSIAYPVYMDNYGLFLGKSYDGFSDTFFRGCIDELRIWNRVRTYREIRENICAETDTLESGLLGYYHCNETDQQFLHDYSGNAEHGTMVNFPDSLRPLSYAQLMPHQPDDVGFKRIVLQWSSSPAYASYTVDLAKDSSFTDREPGFPVTGVNTLYYILEEMEAGSYYFRIKGHYEGEDPDAEPWSQIMQTATITDAATPVIISRFRTDFRDGSIVIDWKTESQTEHARFFLEKREHGRTWSIIGDIPGEGTTSEPKDYRYIDTDILPGKSYDYRLITLSYSGERDSSGIRTLHVPEKAVFTLRSLYPNPFNPETMIRIDMHEQAQIGLYIYSADGRCLSTVHEGILEAGMHQFRWQPRKLPAGLYILNLRSGTFTTSRKILYIK